MPPSRPTAADATQKKKAGEPVAGQAAPPAAEVQSSPAEIAPPQAVGVTSSAEDDDDDLPRPGKVWEGPSLGELMKSQSALSSKPASPKPLSAPTTTAPANAPAAGNVETVSVDDLPGVWKALLALLAQHGPSLHGVLSHGRLVGIEDGRAVIRYGPHHETFVKMLERNGKREIVRDAISRVLSQSVGVKFEVEVGEPTAEAVEPAEAPAPARSPIRPAATAAPPKSAPAPTPSTPGIRVTP